MAELDVEVAHQSLKIDFIYRFIKILDLYRYRYCINLIWKIDIKTVVFYYKKSQTFEMSTSTGTGIFLYMIQGVFWIRIRNPDPVKIVK